MVSTKEEMQAELKWLIDKIKNHSKRKRIEKEVKRRLLDKYGVEI